MDNVPRQPFEMRIARATALIAQYPAAAELLRFYARIAAVQSEIADAIADQSIHAGQSLPSAIDSDRLSPFFPRILDLVARDGPAQLKLLAVDLRSAGRDGSRELLLDYIADQAGERPSAFFARVVVEPYAAALAAMMPIEHSIARRCPVCDHRPQLAVLRPEGDGAKRSLLCSFCLREWDFRRLVCPACGEEDDSNLPTYSTDAFPHVRVEACDTCHHYLKGIDLSRNGLAEPLVDEIAAASLDLWVRDRGYTKIASNLLGL